VSTAYASQRLLRLHFAPYAVTYVGFAYGVVPTPYARAIPMHAYNLHLGHGLHQSGDVVWHTPGLHLVNFASIW
jgi:hypothetical protein